MRVKTEIREKKRGNQFVHGEAHPPHVTKEYRAWRGMKNRCSEKNGENFNNYGSRGIYVCRRWSSYINFLEDMGRAPSKNHSIDRINNNKGYYKSNCRWATHIQQQNNKRSNTIYKIHGIKRTMREWCIIYKVDYELVCNRVIRGYDIESALTIPKIRNNQYKE